MFVLRSIKKYDTVNKPQYDLTGKGSQGPHTDRAGR